MLNLKNCKYFEAPTLFIAKKEWGDVMDMEKGHDAEDRCRGRKSDWKSQSEERKGVLE